MAEYIEREVLKSIFDAKSDMATGMPKVCFASVAKMIDKLPAADVAEVKHGEWKYQPATQTLNPHFYCSNCKAIYFEHYVYNKFTYCPNCGAKMKG